MCPSNKGPTLPQELVDATVDCLFHDRDALQQCSLVCKAWEPRITLHLFSSFSYPRCRHLYHPHHLLPQLNAAGADCDICHSTSTTFPACLSFLASARPGIRKAIRSLKLSGLRRRGTPDTSVPFGGVGMPSPLFNEGLSCAVLSDMLGLLPCLDSVEFRDLLRAEPTTIPIVHNVFTIKEVRIDFAYFPDDLSKILSLFAHINKLEIRRVTMTDEAHRDHTPRRGRTRVDHLVFGGRDLSGAIVAIVSDLRALIPFGLLQSLVLERSDIAVWDTALREAQSLQSLDYYVRGSLPALHPDASLHSLALSAFVPIFLIFLPSEWPGAMHHLRHATALYRHTLRRVRLRIIMLDKLIESEHDMENYDPLVVLRKGLSEQGWSSFNEILLGMPMLDQIFVQLKRQPMQNAAFVTEDARNIEAVVTEISLMSLDKRFAPILRVSVEM